MSYTLKLFYENKVLVSHALSKEDATVFALQMLIAIANGYDAKAKAEAAPKRKRGRSRKVRP